MKKLTILFIALFVVLSNCKNNVNSVETEPIVAELEFVENKTFKVYSPTKIGSHIVLKYDEFFQQNPAYETLIFHTRMLVKITFLKNKTYKLTQVIYILE